MTATHRPTRQHRAAKSRARATDLMIQVGIPHDRYTVAFHTDTCQMWVLDTAGHDEPRGPYPSSRQAWAIANDLNTTTNTTDHWVDR
jgi:hypothetical protein